jgi:hypothetical protein
MRHRRGGGNVGGPAHPRAPRSTPGQTVRPTASQAPTQSSRIRFGKSVGMRAA